jgi:hypothetical protein
MPPGGISLNERFFSFLSFPFLFRKEDTQCATVDLIGLLGIRLVFLI